MNSGLRLPAHSSLQPPTTTVRRPEQIVCPNKDSVCPNSDKIYLTEVTFRFLLLFLLITRSATSFLFSGSWIALFWLPAEMLSLKRLLECTSIVRAWRQKQVFKTYFFQKHINLPFFVMCYSYVDSLFFVDQDD